MLAGGRHHINSGWTVVVVASTGNGMWEPIRIAAATAGFWQCGHQGSIQPQPLRAPVLVGYTVKAYTKPDMIYYGIHHHIGETLHLILISLC
eukprot:2590107-Amphidinium_carterae.1